MDGIEVYCPSCFRRFVVNKSLRGGIASCPECKQAVPVPGGAGGLFWVLLGLGVAAVVGGAVALGSTLGWPIGLLTLAVGGAIIGVLVLAS